MIKWEGYPESENSWEPGENLNCDELLEEFENNLKKDKSRRSTKDKEKTKERERDSDRGEKERKKRDSVTVSEDTDDNVSSNTQLIFCRQNVTRIVVEHQQFVCNNSDAL